MSNENVHAAGTAAYDRNMKEEGAGERAVATRDRNYDEPARRVSVARPAVDNAESVARDTAQRGAGTGEEAVATRGRNYNETVPGAIPALISPTPEQQETMDAAVADENEAKLKAQDEANERPALVPHSSVPKPIADKPKPDAPKTEAKK